MSDPNLAEDVFISELESELFEKLGNDYPYMYDYKYYVMGSLTLVLPKMFVAEDLKDSSIESLIKTKEGDLPENAVLALVQDFVDFVSSLNYYRDSSNPNEAVESGGNCQAMSLLLQSLLSRMNITSNMVLDDNHVYNKVIINDVVYLIDIAKRSVTIES